MKLDLLDLERVASAMRRRAERGFCDGNGSSTEQKYIARCTRIAHGASLIFTRDVGYHSHGTLGSPDYERSWHLSLAPAPGTLAALMGAELDASLRDVWLRTFFGEHVSSLWSESTLVVSHDRRKRVGHWLLFTNAAWKPIAMTSAVCAELVEQGLQSWSGEAERDVA